MTSFQRGRRQKGRQDVGEGVQDLYAHHRGGGKAEDPDPRLLHPSPRALQYKIGQLYMIAKHSAEQSQKGEGVEVTPRIQFLLMR